MAKRIDSSFIDPEMTTDAELAAVESALDTRITALENNAPLPELENRVAVLEANAPNPEFKFVNSKSDFPTSSGGVITLADGVTYFITKTIDLTGDRLVAGNNTVLIGGSSENCFLISTGLSASTALISSVYSLPMRNLSITHGTALNLDATGNPTAALDWFGTNFVDCNTSVGLGVGTIKSYTNFIMSDCALLNSNGMTFDGTIGTVGFINCLFSGIAGVGQTILNFPSTLTITRRIRAIYSSFVSFGGSTSITVSPSAIIPTEAYVLDTINFSGGSPSYLSGVNHTSNTAFFSNCKGVVNSSAIAQMHFNNNTTVTVGGGANNFVKVAGTTSPNAINQKFSHTSNRLTYSGGLNRSFRVGAVVSVSANNGQIVSVRIAKNGVTLADSESQATISANGRFENLKCQTIIEMAPNDFVEVFVANSANTNITAQELNVIVEALN
jgi:hypothetical protein